MGDPTRAQRTTTTNDSIDVTTARVAEKQPRVEPPATQSRLSYLPPLLDVGDQIAGSSHVFELAAPFNGGASEARLSVTLTGNPAFSLESAPEALDPLNSSSASEVLTAQLAKKLRVRFAPPLQTSGRVYGELTVMATWSDGATASREIRVIQLEGHARSLDERPAPNHEQRAKAREDYERSMEQDRLDRMEQQEVENYRGTKSPPHWAELRSQGALNRATSALDAIYEAQDHAITLVNEKVKTYAPPPAPQSVWWDLAKAAVVLGSTQLTGIVLRIITEQIAVAIGAAAKSATAASVASTVNGFLAKNITAALSSPTTTEVEQPNARLAFFESQTKALERVSKNNKDDARAFYMARSVHLAEDPEGVVKALQAMAAGFDGAVPHAGVLQTSASATEWLAYKARLEQGTATLDDGTRVTELAKARTSKHPTPDGVRGVLDLMVQLEHGTPQLKGARVQGIARSLVGDIARGDLRASRVPLRLVVGWNEPDPVIITRDEGDRVRVSGNFERLTGLIEADGHVKSEAQAERAARMIVDAVLSRSLAAWGIQIATDDHGER